MKINGSAFKRMVASAANALSNQKSKINDMNVFPVPDGDTGSNMSMTLSAVEKLPETGEDSLHDSADQVAGNVLRHARGNSGVILSLFFRGAAKSMENLEEADSEDMAKAFRAGADEAYRAVNNPTEGTILTVMRACADEAEKAVRRGKVTMEKLFENMYRVSRDTLKKTPDMLPALKRANVVDAGGFGFVVALQGMTAALRGKPVKRDENAEEPVASAAALSDVEITFPYCTECIVAKDEAHAGEGTAEELRAFLAGIGDSLVFVDDREIIKLHVHTDQPGRVLTEALAYGALETVKIENMRLQHTELAGAAGQPEAVTSRETGPVHRPPEKPVGFVAVSCGEGLSAVFTDLGVDTVVTGGQTMNPSTEELEAAVYETPAETVFLLPNNKNVCMSAEAAASLVTDRHVVVVPTRTVQEGMGALMAYEDGVDPGQAAQAMCQAAERVISVFLTRAVRDSALEDGTVHEGECVALLGTRLSAHGESYADCLTGLSEQIAGASFVTLFSGADADDSETEQLTGILAGLAPDAEVTVVDGGQPVYPYLISCEP